ncbi:MAG: hypothetical protein JW793_09965, partial [Acidobacteria bacterium]|nr:hypothetical protein [Acidobacteriota bacterium]
RRFVGIVRRFVGIVRRFVGIVRRFVGIVRRFVGIVRRFVGIVRRFVGILRRFVGTFRRFVGTPEKTFPLTKYSVEKGEITRFFFRAGGRRDCLRETRMAGLRYSRIGRKTSDERGGEGKEKKS